MVVKLRNLSQRDYLYKFFELVDCMQMDPDKKMSNSEKKVMVEFYDLPEAFENYRFLRMGRLEVMKRAAEHGWKLSRQNLNNRIYDLIGHGILYREPDGVLRAKPWIEKVIKNIKESYNNGTEYDIKFRFSGV